LLFVDQQRDSIVLEMKESLEKCTQESKSAAAKFEAQKNFMKEQELAYLAKISKLEKESAILKEKLECADLKELERTKDASSEVAELKMQASALTEQLSSEKKLAQLEYDRLKKAIQLLEQEKFELRSNLDKGMMLWEGKFSFIEQQKEQLKADYSESLKKFELTLQHVTKARSSEKLDFECQLREASQQL